MKILTILSLFLSCAFAHTVTYEGYTVYRLSPKTEAHRSLLTKLQYETSTLDFWTPRDVMVAPDGKATFVNMLRENGLDWRIYIEDVQRKIDEERQENALIEARANMSWDRYHELEAINAWIDEIAVEHAGDVAVVTLGNSHEGRAIKGVRIDFGNASRAVLFDGTLHAREWITPATLTYVINEILTNQDPKFRNIAESFVWHIFPVMNPDGYVYSHKTDRLWRKTRAPHGSCFGADPNRNFDFYWGQFGASSDPCSTTYAGPRAFSEIEVNSLRNYIGLQAPFLDVYLSFHSYGQLFLIPYGNTTDHLGNYNDLRTIATSAINATRVKYGTVYRTGNSAEVLYYSSGTSKDWVKDAHNISLSYTVELRDTGTSGFLLPPSQILPNNREIMDGLVAMFEEGERLGYLKFN